MMSGPNKAPNSLDNLWSDERLRADEAMFIEFGAQEYGHIVGESFGENLRDVILEGEYLAHSEEALKEAARRCGFKDFKIFGCLELRIGGFDKQGIEPSPE